MTMRSLLPAVASIRDFYAFEQHVATCRRHRGLELELSGDGRVTGTLPVIQSQWGIKPYRAFMGALKVRDDVEIVLDAWLPSS